MTYTAKLTAPDGTTEEHSVVATNKKQARKKIGDRFRLNVPRAAAAHGFYSFTQQRLEWVSEED